MSSKKSLVVQINDIFDELKDENKRLLNELLFAKKSLKIFVEYKTFVELLFGKYGQSFDTIDADYYHQELTKSAEEVLTSDNQWITNGVGSKESDDNKHWIRIRSDANEDDIYGSDPDYSPNFDIKTEKLENKTKFKVRLKPNRLNISENSLQDICDLCSETIDPKTRRTHMKKHLERYKSREPNKHVEYVCDHIECYYRSTNQQYFIAHINGHKGVQPFQCGSCGQSFPNALKLRNHFEAKHRLSSQLLVCDVDGCGQQYETQSALRAHRLRRHSTPKFVCGHPDCGKMYVFRVERNKHELTHSTDRPFKCQIEGCPKSFATETLLRTHLEYHSSDRKYRCSREECGKAFKTKANLRAHMKGIHTEKSLSCDWPGCDYMAATNHLLKSHRMSHSEVKPFRCQWKGCGKGFKQSQKLKMHLLIHTGEKNFRCCWPGCQYRCNRKDNLEKHMQIHGSGLEYGCDWPDCGKRFKTKESLNNHIKTHTKFK